MHYTLTKIATLIGARRYGSSDAVIDWLLTDSRSLAFPETTLFFALRTALGDGSNYIADLYRRGVRSFVVRRLPDRYEKLYPEACFLVVVSPLKALQRLAERHREEYDIPVIGITGSNGKTMVKEWLYQLLSPGLRVTRSPRSYNSQVGVPLSVCLLDSRSNVGIFEAGISQPGEMQPLADIIQPTIGIITNLGEAHQENFLSMEEKGCEKLLLFKHCGLLICCKDDAAVAASLAKADFKGTLLAWSKTDSAAPLYVESIGKTDTATCITYQYKANTRGTYTLPFIDEAAIDNSLHCLATCLHMGLDAETIAERMARLEPVAMRLEVKEGVRGCTIINDSYNSDITSLGIALDFMNRRPSETGEARRTLILSDILQSGIMHMELYSRVAEMVNSRGITKLIGVGPEITRAAGLFRVEDHHFFTSSEQLLESSLLDTLEGEVILIKGARSFGFEKIGERLAKKVHETTLEVNLEALAANLNHYRSFMKPETKMVCMVKASAYGSGSIEVAKTLQDRGVDYLAVAVADEGAELRKAGITRNIMVMNPEMTAFDTLFQYSLEPEVYSFALLEALILAAKKRGITNYPIHIKLDTGMSRLGFCPETDMERLIERLQRQYALIPRSVFSHFAGSDSPDFDAFSDQQFARFKAASEKLQAAFPHKILRHICNSAGIERFPERHLDMVRLGLGLYGISPITNKIIHNVCTLKTTILQLRDISAETTVGYSRRGKLGRPARIAALPIGYADGLNRHLGNGRGYCLINGKKAPYVGNICMDVCMADVTDIDCHEGDSVEIFGDALPVTALSDLLGTIPYEVLTSVSERVKRIYYQG